MAFFVLNKLRDEENTITMYDESSRCGNNAGR